MSCRRLYATPLQAILILTASHAHAAGPISPESDILGVNLTMSRDQARALISSSYPASKIIDLPVQIGTPEYKKSATAGFTADITSAEDQANNQQKNEQAQKEFQARQAAGFGNSPLNMSVASPGDYGREQIYVQVNPNDNSTDIFGVSRYKEFSKAHAIPATALLQSYVEKYGQPSVSQYGENFTWMAPGVVEKTRNPPVRCSLSTESDSYLYENPKNPSPQFIADSFVRAINNINAGDTLPYYNYSKCGTVLQLTLALSNDKRYALSMNATLIDLTKARAELKQFAADFFAHANAAKQEKMSRDSLNKPKL
jgi:hypothetical protein